MARKIAWACVGGGVFLLQCLWFRRFAIDDAFITYRYARNWAEGLGPVMNAGERVEGVSNLPWTGVLALASAGGLDPHRAGPLLGVIAAVVCAVAVAVLARHGAQRTPHGAVLLFVCSAPVAIWGISGLETLSYAAAVTLCLLLLLRPRAISLQAAFVHGSVLGVVAVWRPEGALLFLAWIPFAWASLLDRRAAACTLAGFLTVLVPVSLARFAYYGAWLPNSVVAKATLSTHTWLPGLAYAGKFAIAFLPLLVLCALGVQRIAAPGRWLLLAWLVLQFGFVVATGGERFPGYRFAVAALPVLVVFAAASMSIESTSRPHGRGPQRPWLLAFAVVVGLACSAFPGSVATVLGRIATPLRLQQEPERHRQRLQAEARFAGLALLAASGVGLVRRRQPPVALGACAVWLLTANVLDPSLRACRQPDPAAAIGRSVGSWLRQAAPADVLVATNAAGALPYFSRLPVIDMLGLTDAHIARSQPDRRRWIGHEKGDADYVLRREPDIVILSGPEGSATAGPFAGDTQLVDDARFRDDYEVQLVALDAFVFTYWRRRDGRMPQRFDAPTREDRTWD